MMNAEQIIEKYKKHCGKLKPIENMTPTEFQSVRELERFISEGTVKADDVIKAFKKANKSKFLTGQVKDFQADIRWMTNPVNIEKVLSGKYDDKPKKASFDFSGEEEKELELEQHLRNQEKLKKIRADRHHQEWLKNYWFNKYPNLRSEEDGEDTNIYS